MNPIFELNKQLSACEQEIANKILELNKAREDHLTAKARHERDYAMFLLRAKIEDSKMTQSEIKAQAINLSYESKLEAIKKESTYMKLKTEFQGLHDKLDSLREQSYNLRFEAKLQ